MTAGLAVDVAHQQGTFVLEARFSAPGGVVALFGPSGSGKTTLVNVIGGLLRPRRGRVAVGDTVLLDTEAGLFVPPHRRRIGTVFQEGRLFPHLSVRQNLLFGRWFAPRSGRRVSVPAVVDLLGIGPLLARRPGALSGGEKQRVAIGRALLSEPRLLLMDEPLAALDEARKAEILPYVERLRDEAGVPIVYVSHAVAEVARLADTIVRLDVGRVAAFGSADALLASLDGAAARDAGAVIEARVAAQDAAFGLTTLATRVGDLRVPRIGLPVGTAVRLYVPARDVLLSLVPPERSSALNLIAGTIAAVSPPDGRPTLEVRLDCNGAPLLARITRRSFVDLDLAPGRAVFAIVKSVALDAGPRGAPGLARYDGSM